MCCSQRACAFAILGFGDIVFDPSHFGKLVEQLTQMERQYTQMVQTYQMVAQYSQMIFMARMVPANLRARYRTLITPWRNSSATDTYGTTGGWIIAINTGHDVPDSYQQATQPLNAYGAALSNIPAEQLDRVKTNYATVELADGANQRQSICSVACVPTLPRSHSRSKISKPTLSRRTRTSIARLRC